MKQMVQSGYMQLSHFKIGLVEYDSIKNMRIRLEASNLKLAYLDNPVRLDQNHDLHNM